MTDQARSERVGFVGVGNQGGPMAMRIALAGLPLTVWARRPEALDEYVDAGVDRAPDLRGLAQRCQLVAVCVTTDADVLDVCLGEAGLVTNMSPGSSLCIHSTAHPGTIATVHAASTERGVRLLDAPVSGGNAGAKAGTMAIMCGGAVDDLDRWRPVFATYARSVELVGPVGAGQLAKLVNNALSSVTTGASVWALRSAVALGLDRDAMLRVLMASSGASFMLPNVPTMIDVSAQLAADRYRKDLGLYERVVPTDDDDGRSLVAAAEAAVATLEAIAVTQR
ncbi:MAG: NAD(P)-dependent oxidoreductase [Acidimicrobiia bacterium]